MVVNLETDHCVVGAGIAGLLLGERLQLGFGERVVHATAGDDERLLGLAERRGGSGELGKIGAGPGDAVQLRFEERHGEVERLGLHILG